MKKLVFSLITVLSLLVVFITISSTSVYAAEVNLMPYNSSYETSGQDWYEYHAQISLLENSNYSFETLFSNFASTISGNSNAGIEYYVSVTGGVMTAVSYNGLLGVIPNYTRTFTTGATAATLYFDFVITGAADDVQGIQIMFESSLAKLYWTGYTSLPDGVEPEFSYSNLSRNTPYYALVTAAEIQAQLHATDDEDGDVTSRIEIYEDHYTLATKVVGGDYYIMYRVSDLSGNYAYLRVDIEVIDDRQPTFESIGLGFQDGDDCFFSWYSDDPNGSLDYQNFFDMFTAIDEYYGYYNVVTWTLVDNNNFSASEDDWRVTPGTYYQILTYTDPSGNSSTYTINSTVLLNNAPVITGTASKTVEITSFNISTILASYSATDVEDGVVSITIDPSSPWNYGSPTIGDFSLLLRATDSLGKYSTKSVVISVVDTTIPVIKINNIGVTTYAVTVNMSNTSTLQALIDSIVVMDAYYGNITAALVVPAFPSFTVPGTTVLSITCTDASGNIATLSLTVTIADDILPVINGATKIVKGKTASLTLSEITAQVSAIDNVSGGLTVTVVTDGYTGNATTVGSYLVRFKATDGAGNIAYQDVRIWVVDNIAPVWSVNDYFVNLGINEAMTRTQLIALLQASGMVANDISYTVTFLTDEYTGNEEISGVYSVVMRITYEDGSEDNISLQLSVPEVEDDVIVVIPDTPQTGLQKFFTGAINFFKSIYNAAKSAVSWVSDKATWVWEHLIVPAYNFIFVKETTETIPPVTTTTPLITTTVTTSSVITLPATTTTNPAQSL